MPAAATACGWQHVSTIPSTSSMKACQLGGSKGEFGASKDLVRQVLLKGLTENRLVEQAAQPKSFRHTGQKFNYVVVQKRKASFHAMALSMRSPCKLSRYPDRSVRISRYWHFSRGLRRAKSFGSDATSDVRGGCFSSDCVSSVGQHGVRRLAVGESQVVRIQRVVRSLHVGTERNRSSAASDADSETAADRRTASSAVADAPAIRAAETRSVGLSSREKCHSPKRLHPNLRPSAPL